MSRLIFLFAIAAVVYLLLKSFRRTEKPSSPAAEDMVCCARCGVHLPIGESIRAEGKHYCSAAHRDSKG